ncbi:hypothetical protein [Pontibacter akesuensis]|uniref:Uncharacterized protein n=1 Tax=Pontibacter akesuensis TaxID=388950 RepID=A0A1I7I7Z2_9BACT|nr:hypothetical protein [Pontibacter akesuensis]GHA65698.1 hypothetical protein GCM10007389_18280 [Pontibacter akesuensis]SFU69067.1 hypothetical protein SAMN04487941_1995 [Pontibacter akesuensis]
MKIVLLILAIILGMGLTIKQSAKEVQEIAARQELSKYKGQPNLLPMVEVVAPRI